MLEMLKKNKVEKLVKWMYVKKQSLKQIDFNIFRFKYKIFVNIESESISFRSKFCYWLSIKRRNAESLEFIKTLGRDLWLRIMGRLFL